ncbi:MAG: H(+)-transporting ATPase [bacterium]|nr:H(+)-transporting ATPase [bacterium]
MKTKKIHPYFIIILTFLGVILTGTIFLLFPVSGGNGKSIGFVDALFMSTSAVCVTGLGTVNVASGLSLFGKVILAILMEIGGLSILTIAIFFFTILGAKLSVSNKFLLREALNQSSVKGVTTLVIKIVIWASIIQLVGVILNMFALLPYYDGNFSKALGYSVFHSIASFNNAGFDAFGTDSMIGFKDNLMLNTSTMFLIIFGGIGFIVLSDIIKKRNWKLLQLHTKIVLITTGVLIFFGALLIKLTAWTDITWLQAFFTSVTCRTAGFTTYDMSELTNHPATYVIIIFLMFIGASPCSTGGGIKTTTLAVAIISTVYYARGKKAKVFKRKIDDAQIFKSFVLIGVGIMIVMFGTFVVCAAQKEITLMEGLFEVVSAFSTTGLSMGITGSLNVFNKLFICLIMFTGRLGPLTIIGLVNKNWMTESNEEIQYVEESVIIG